MHEHGIQAEQETPEEGRSWAEPTPRKGRDQGGIRRVEQAPEREGRREKAWGGDPAEAHERQEKRISRGAVEGGVLERPAGDGQRQVDVFALVEDRDAAKGCPQVPRQMPERVEKGDRSRHRKRLEGQSARLGACAQGLSLSFRAGSPDREKETTQAEPAGAAFSVRSVGSYSIGSGACVQIARTSPSSVPSAKSD